MKTITLGIKYGAALGPIVDQLRSAGIKASIIKTLGSELAVIQEMADAVSLLNLHYILTDSQTSKARKEIMNILTTLLNGATIT